MKFVPERDKRYRLKFEIHTTDPALKKDKAKVAWLTKKGFVDILPAGLEPWKVPVKVDPRQHHTHLQASIGKAGFVVQSGRWPEIVLVDYSTRPAKMLGARASKSRPGLWAVWTSFEPQKKIERYASASKVSLPRRIINGVKGFFGRSESNVGVAHGKVKNCIAVCDSCRAKGHRQKHKVFLTTFGSGEPKDEKDDRESVLYAYLCKKCRAVMDKAYPYKLDDGTCFDPKNQVLTHSPDWFSDEIEDIEDAF